MTAVARVASGMAVSWVRITLSFLIQIALVPLYLTYWDRDTYGLWLLFHAVAALLTVVDIGHQNFLQNEFMQVGEKDRTNVARIFYSSIPAGLCIGIVQVLLACVLVWSGGLGTLVGASSASMDLTRDIGVLLVINSIVWMIVSGVGGIAVRILFAFGYFVRLGWWGVLHLVFAAGGPAVAVVLGADLLVAGIVYIVSSLVASAACLVDVSRIMLKEGILPTRPDFSLGLRNFNRSLMLTLKSILDMAQQQMLRVVLSPLAGVSQMAAFATMRTGANVAMQGLGSLTNPLLPELMGFLRGRDQAKSDATLGVVWIAVIAVMAPLLVALQWAMPYLFPLWTRDRFVFEPMLFAFLSIGILIFAIAQPAASVVQGQNLLRSQLAVAATCAMVVIGLTWAIVPRIGLVGAALALLISELVAMVFYVRTASLWLRQQKMTWPVEMFRVSCVAVVIAAAEMMVIALVPNVGGIVTVVAVIVQIAVVTFFWKQMPSFAVDRAKGFLKELALVRNLRRLAQR